jgi:hypothetical protein
MRSQSRPAQHDTPDLLTGRGGEERGWEVESRKERRMARMWILQCVCVCMCTCLPCVSVLVYACCVFICVPVCVCASMLVLVLVV